MRKRRIRDGAYRPPPLSPMLLSQFTERRRPRRGRGAWRQARPLSVLLGLLLAVALAAVVASATDTTHVATTPPSVRTPVPSVDRPAHGAARPAGGASSRTHAGAAPAPTPDSQSAVDKVLRYTPFITVGGPGRRLIALTFDDGPGPYTERIITVLARMHAPATFFIVGQQVPSFPGGVGDELRHGFVVGDHTENHLWLARLTPGDQYGQVKDAAARATHAGAPFPRLFRPPYGIYDAHTLAVLRALRMLMVLWSIDPGDWRRPGTGAIITSVLSAARPGGIVEMHDGGGDRSETVAALPDIINGLRRRHYELVTVPQLLREDPPPPGQRPPQLGAA